MPRSRSTSACGARTSPPAAPTPRCSRRQGILSEADATAIDEGLAAVGLEIGDGKLVEDPALEDIHMHVEHRLSQLIGEPAGRLHTARSRNDQVATDFKLFVRGAIDEAVAGIDALEARAARPRRRACRDASCPASPTSSRASR